MSLYHHFAPVILSWTNRPIRRMLIPMSRKPIDHPAAWTAAELETRTDWEHPLSTAERKELLEAARSVAGLKESAITTGCFPLPSLAPRLSRIQETLEHGSGAALLRGLDLSELPEPLARRLFLGLCSHLGTPLSQSAEGELVFSVRDAGFADSDPRARGPNTRKKLSFHTDRCDVIAFLCLHKAAQGGENQIVSSMSVYNRILRERPDLLEVLSEPFLYKRHTVDTANPLPYCEQPIFSLEQGHFASAFLRVLIERAYAGDDTPAMTAKQREALDLVEETAADPELHHTFLQEPGDVLLLNNWVTYHRRTEFTDETGHPPRHILRIWLSMPNSRPLAHWFEANYGATEAGALRGGMPAST